MAFAQLRHRLPFITRHQPGDATRPNARIDAQHDTLIAGSTVAIARSIDLLVRTDNLPGMDKDKPSSGKRPLRL